jgi:WD40 repeat protein/serine/threonine protein kinase/tetratricopeptide (TPR) repeat protein
MNLPEHSLRSIFLAALEIGDAQEREDFLSKTCGADSALRREVEELLQAEAAAGLFLPEKPTAPRMPAGLLATAEAGGDTDRLDTPIAEKPGDRIGRYKLLQKIGEGGCGVVYMAEQEQPVRRKVALKIIKLGMDSRQVIARFEAERQALALMDHPNIARIFDAGVTGLSPFEISNVSDLNSQITRGRPYFAMELVRGIKITTYCDRHELSTRQRLELFTQVCQAVQHAHQKGIIHRDLKPSNILVTEDDGVPVPKVIDFGIAKATEGRLTDQTLFTAFEQFLGTPAYMSPEQAAMTILDIDTRSDIYSLGVLLYELLTGTTPFNTKALLAVGLDELRRTIRETAPVRPSTRLSTMLAGEQASTARRHQTEALKLVNLLRGDLDWIVMKCLEKDRTRRYDTANGLAADIKRHLNCEPVIARPPSRFYEFQKTLRRHKIGFAATGAVILALAAGVVVSTLEAVRARRAERDQARLRDRAQRLLSTVEVQRAQTYFAADDAARGLAFLASGLRQNPMDDVVAHQLVNELSLRGWLMPALAPLQHSDALYAAEFSPDGRQMATASYDGKAWIWDTASGKRLVGPLQHQAAIRSIRFSPDGRYVATASWDGTARVWDAKTGQPVTQPLQHSQEVWSAEWSPDGRFLVTASYDSTAKVWDIKTSEAVATLQHHSKVAWAEFSPDGRWVATASWDRTAQVWEALTGRPVSSHPLTHKREVWMIRFSPDARRVATASWDQTAQLWDPQTGEPLATEPLQHTGPVVSVKFSPDGQRVLTASWDGTARLWDAATGKPIGTPMRHRKELERADFSPDGQLVATASLDHTARLWDARTGLPLSEPLFHEAEVRSALFSPDQRKLLTASDDHSARLWDVRLPLQFMRALSNSASFASMSFDGRGQPDQHRSEVSGTSLNPPQAPVPVPDWLPNLAEAIIGKRVPLADVDPAIPSPERSNQSPRQATNLPPTQTLVELKKSTIWNRDTDFYSRWARWLLAEPSSRTLSPASSATGYDYVQTLVQEQSIAGLREAVRLQPTNIVALDRLSRRLLETAAPDNLSAPGEADWWSRRAAELDPNHWEACWSKAEVLQHLGNSVQASEAMRQGARQQPPDPLFWGRYGQMLGSAGQLDKADIALTQGLALCRTSSPTLEPALIKLLLQRAQVRRGLGRLEDAATDNQSAFNIRPRDPQTPNSCVDLSLYYNASLDVDWWYGDNGWTFAAIPHGRVLLGGVEFDVRGLVQLSSPSFGARPISYPARVSNIRLGRKCRRLHFLHATGWSQLEGVRIGEYTMHFEDGSTQALRLIYGEDLRDWGAAWTDHKTQAKSASVAWKGDIPHRTGGEGCLYLRTWENPNPEMEIVSMDFESSMTDCAPFLVAVTAE